MLLNIYFHTYLLTYLLTYLCTDEDEIWREGIFDMSTPHQTLRSYQYNVSSEGENPIIRV